MNRKMDKVRSCYEACKNNDVDAVRRALEEGFVVDICDGYKNTLLHESARHGCTEIVSLLLEYKADVNVQNKNGNTPLNVSARCGRTEIVSLLLEFKADVNVQDKDGNTPLHVSAHSGHKEIVSLLLANMDNVNVKDYYGYTPLHHSVYYGHKEIVSMLLSKKADVNVQDEQGKTPLHLSAQFGHTGIISLLLENKADVNVQDERGKTPLHLSAVFGRTEIVSLLLENKADVNVKCAEGLSPIDYTNKTSVVNVLLKHGAVRYKHGTVQYKQSFLEHPVSGFKSGMWSQTSTTTKSVKVTVTPGVEDNKDRPASTSFSHTRTIEIKDEVTNTIRNDPAQIYEKTDQHKIPGLESISKSGHGQSLASAIAGRVEQAVTDCVKEFTSMDSRCHTSVATDVSTSQQNGATVVIIQNTFNINEINIPDTREVKCTNANIEHGKFVSLGGPLNIVYGSTETDDDDDNDGS